MTKTLSDIPATIQDVPPKWAHFCLHVEKFIRDDLGLDLTGKTIIVGVSGGVDSTALLLVLHYLAQKNRGQVICAHLNHQLRPEAADDADWVKAVCDLLSIPCSFRSVDVRSMAQNAGIGLEEAGRDARYDFFEEVRELHGADIVALGHHLGDLSEDILMRLIRGTGWPGLSGMPGIDKNRHLMRPFLLVPKSQLIEFLTALEIGWREDATNADPAWTRNRIRHDILPLLLKENPHFSESLARLWKIGKIDQEYWTEKTSGVSEVVSADRLNSTHQAERLRLYKAALSTLSGGQALADTLFKLDAAWLEQRFGAVFQFPGKKTATITTSGVVFATKD